MRKRTVGTCLLTFLLVVAMAVPAYAHVVFAFSQSSGGVVWGRWSVQNVGTYDGDGIIAAKVDDVDPPADGSCVSAIYRDGGNTFNQAQSCNNWVNHLFFDQTGNSSAEVRVDRSNPDPAGWVHISGY